MIIAVLSYFLITGLYYTYKDHPKQDECVFGTVTNAEYLKILNSMTYDLSDLKHDIDLTRDNYPNEHDNLTKILTYTLEKQLVGTDDFNKTIATSHAFMRRIGYSNYESGRTKWRAHLSDRMHYFYRLEYKLIGAKLNLFNIIGLITRDPSTVSIQIETDEFYNNSGLFNLSAYFYNGFLSSIPNNFGQHYSCPSNLKIQISGYTFNKEK